MVIFKRALKEIMFEEIRRLGGYVYDMCSKEPHVFQWLMGKPIGGADVHILIVFWCIAGWNIVIMYVPNGREGVG